MKVFIERSKEEKQLEFEGSLKDLMNDLGINSEEVIVSVNGEVATEEETVSGDDVVKFLSVVSGG